MALLKFLKGNAGENAEDLNAYMQSKGKEGWVYITTDTNDMYIQAQDKSTEDKIHLNANYANRLRETNTLNAGKNAGGLDLPVYFLNGIPVEAIGVATKTQIENLSTTVENYKYKVTQKAAITANGSYPVILATDTAITEKTAYVNKASTLTYNPFTKVLTTTTFKGALDGTAARATSDASGNVITTTYATQETVNDLSTTVNTNATAAKNASNLTSGRISSFDRIPTTTANRVITSNDNGQLGASDITVSELKTLDGIDTTQKIEDRLDSKQDKISLTANRAVITNGSGTLAVSSGVTASELEYLAGVTSDIQTQLNGKESTITLTASRALVSNSNGKVAVSAVTSTELGYLDGVTSAIQTQLNGKEPTINLTTNRALVSNSNGKVTYSSVTSTELGYLSGATSNIQNQINALKNATASSASKVAVTAKNSGYIYLTGVTSSSDSTSASLYVTSGSTTALGPRIETSTKALYGAVWNDYAECRETKEDIKPGRVVCETGKGDLVLSTERLQAGANIVSDTFGFIIGETSKAKTPIAVSGRVLAYPLEDRILYAAGDAVCAGPNGTVSIMTREEIREYPDRILGTVSEIPDYEVWGENDIVVDGRIWIKVR